MKHRKQKHDNIYQGKLLFNPFPEELKKIREEMRAELPKQNRKKIIAYKACEDEAWKEGWDKIRRECLPIVAKRG